MPRKQEAEADMHNWSLRKDICTAGAFTTVSVHPSSSNAEMLQG